MTRRTNGPEHPECDPTCPRQAEHTVASCECGGAARSFEAFRDRLAGNRPTAIPTPRRPLHDTPPTNRPTEYLEHEDATTCPGCGDPISDRYRDAGVCGNCYGTTDDPEFPRGDRP